MYGLFYPNSPAELTRFTAVDIRFSFWRAYLVPLNRRRQHIAK